MVSTDAGGIPYLLTHEVEALLVSPGDDQAMANAVRRILNEPKLSEQLSRKARTKAERFDFSAIVPQWQQLLTSIREPKSDHDRLSR